MANENLKNQCLQEDDKKRARELVSKMTLNEKVKQMAGKPFIYGVPHIPGYGRYATFNTPPVKRLGMPGIRFIDGPRGVNLMGSTAFPVAMGRGATWDRKLEERVSNVMGYEARAGGANFSGAVCINVLRHPSWGRAQETFGEDPYHIGCMAVSMLTGLQNHVMACAKHFAANSIEESRFFVDVKMDERTLREVYLPHFKMCVDAGVASIMSAYNKLNGKWCSHSPHLLKKILKEEWGFQGFVISDFIWAVKNATGAVNAGLDIEMPFTLHFGKKLKKAVQQGKVPEEAVDEAVTRIFQQQLRFSRLKTGNYNKQNVAGPEHTTLARETAQKGMVLLKNENTILPLDQKKIKKIAVLGKLADMANLGDKGSSSVRPPYVITPLQGIRNRAGSTIEVMYDNGKNLSLAEQIARDADVVVVIAGFTHKEEGEYIKEIRIGGDRVSLDLLKRDKKLISAVSKVNKNCIVALESGTAITMESWIDSIPAVLMIWYPGMEGGNALSNILFGDVNPSGKLPINFPRSVNQLFRFDNKAKEVEYHRYHGYRYFDKLGHDPLFYFGYGLSYTTYRYDKLTLDKNTIKKDEEIEITVHVTNTGEMAGEEIVQIYISYSGSCVDRPKKDLKGFGRLALNPGETGKFTCRIKAEDLAYYDTEKASWVVEEIEYKILAGASSRKEDLNLSDSFNVIC